MSSLNISLPEQLKSFVETQVGQGDYGTPSEYIRELIRREKERQRERLESELVEALHAGEIELSAKDLRNPALVTVLRNKLAARKRRKA